MTLTYYFLLDPDRNGNLHHVAYLLDFILRQSPVTSMHSIIDHNLLFSVLRYLYNPTLYNVIESKPAN